MHEVKTCKNNLVWKFDFQERFFSTVVPYINTDKVVELCSRIP